MNQSMAYASVENLAAARECVLQLAHLYGLQALVPGVEIGAVPPSLPLCASKTRLLTAKAWVRANRLRTKHLDGALFADPAWDILLDLYINRLESRPISVTSACMAANVPPTTALRWLTTLTNSGWLQRSKDASDGRRYFIEMPDKVAAAMDALFDEVMESDRKLGGARATATSAH